LSYKKSDQVSINKRNITKEEICVMLCNLPSYAIIKSNCKRAEPKARVSMKGFSNLAGSSQVQLGDAE
jgi:hypothetical protein